MKCILLLASTETWITIICYLSYHVTATPSCRSRYSPSYHGNCRQPSTCTGATLRSGCDGDPTTTCCVEDRGLSAIQEPVSPTVSRKVFYEMVGDTTRTRSLFPLLDKMLEDAGLSKEFGVIPAFLAQIFHETSSLDEMEEASNGMKYEGNTDLGNTQPGDGRRFIARGFMPVVGRYMYGAVGKAIGQDLIELAAMPSVAAEIAVWLWKNGYNAVRYHGNSLSSSKPIPLSSYCDDECKKYDFARLTYAIKGGASGMESRLKYWSKTLNALNVSCPADGDRPNCTVGDKKGSCVLKDMCRGQYVDGVCARSSLTTCCIDCQIPLDIAFIVDSSGSVGPQEFVMALDFVAKVCQFFDISLLTDGTRVALIRYAGTAEIIFKFDTFANKADLLTAIRNTSFSTNVIGTYTDKALTLANKHLFGNPLNGVRSRYLGVSRVLVLLTDGKATSGTQSIIEPSKMLKDDGVNIFVIGVGKSLTISELEEIASDPAVDYVHLLNSFRDFGAQTFRERLQKDSCYEPALLDQDMTVISTLPKNAIKYYKYWVANVTSPLTVQLRDVQGQTMLQVSLVNKNPRTSSLNWNVCSSHSGGVTNNSPTLDLNQLGNDSFCFSYPNGFVSWIIEQNGGRAKFVVVRSCRSKWLFVSVEGVKAGTNRFNMSLVNESVVFAAQNISSNNSSNKSSNKSSGSNKPMKGSHELEVETYVGSAVAAGGTLAAVAAYTVLSCAGKSFEVKSSKISKKKKKKEESDLSAVENGGDTCSKGNGKLYTEVKPSDKTLTPPRTRSTIVTFMINAMQRKSSRNVIQDTELRESRESHVNSICVQKTSSASELGFVPRDSSRTRLIRSEENDLESDASKMAGRKNNTNLEKGTQRGRKVQDIKGIEKGQMVASESNNSRSARSNSKFQTKISTNGKRNGKTSKSVTFGSTSHRNNNTNSKGKSTFKMPNNHQRTKGEDTAGLPEQSTETVTCTNCTPQFSSTKVKKSSEDRRDDSLLPDEEVQQAEETRTSSNSELIMKEEVETSDEDRSKKKSWRATFSKYATRRYFLAVACPCFNYYILKEDGNAETATEKKSMRFERDMHLSQACCILISQGIFLAGIDAKSNEALCAAVAISMNYFYLVAFSWLLAEACYLFFHTESFFRRPARVHSCYLGCWGFPLVVVLLLSIGHSNYSSKPHCWISFAEATSWAVSTPLITMSLVQIILTILLLKTLLTYKNAKNDDETNEKKDIIRSGLKSVVCIFITVLCTWLLGTVSMNSEDNTLQYFFALFNAAQGVLVFVFYVILNPEIQQFVIQAKTFIMSTKSNSVTPFDEHERMEIEREKQDDDDKKKKDKKEKKGKKQKKDKTNETLQSQHMNIPANIEKQPTAVSKTSQKKTSTQVNQNVTINKSESTTLPPVKDYKVRNPGDRRLTPTQNAKTFPSQGATAMQPRQDNRSERGVARQGAGTKKPVTAGKVTNQAVTC